MEGALSAQEFERGVERFPRLSKKAQAIGRAILVEGQNISEVAELYGTNRQNCHWWAKQIYRMCVPEGWVSEVVTLPSTVMKKVRALEQDERAKWKALQESKRAAHAATKNKK